MKIIIHQDLCTHRWWWIVIGRLNGLDTTYSKPMYRSERKAMMAAQRYIQRMNRAQIAEQAELPL